MPMRFAFIAALFLALNLFSEEENTQSRLTKFANDVAETWRTYPTDKDETARRQKIQDLNTAMTGSINKLSAPENITLDKCISNYFSALDRVRGLFKLGEKQNAERSQYIAVCAQVFRREIPFSTDLQTERTASKCFGLLEDWASDAKTRMRTIPEEAHGLFYTSLNEVFNQMMKYAKKDEGDPTAIYDRELKEIKRRFPTTNEAFQKVNQPIATMLENAAKMQNTFNKK
ncbi:MAG TPA: hypothetical protein VKX17_15305 [Planctomycetota bacterium]|nr:hypothetical protein [Planctomycetota bacterium]